MEGSSRIIPDSALTTALPGVMHVVSEFTTLTVFALASTGSTQVGPTHWLIMLTQHDEPAGTRERFPTCASLMVRDQCTGRDGSH